MATTYTRVVSTGLLAASNKACVRLPAAPRGKLKRVFVAQTNGTDTFSALVYTRKGACESESDLNIEDSGSVSSVADSGGNFQVTFVSPHAMQVGDTFEIKENSNAAYNVVHEISRVVSDLVVTTTTSYAGAGTGGVWQTEPLSPTSLPANYQLHTVSVTSGASDATEMLDVSYLNQDNQDIHRRSPASALWLEVDLSGIGTPTTLQVTVTTESDTMD